MVAYTVGKHSLACQAIGIWRPTPQALCRLANLTVIASTAPLNSNAAMQYIPFAVDPVASLIHPTRNGMPKPARFPIELMIAMPAAAAAPFRNAVGKFQNNGDADNT